MQTPMLLFEVRPLATEAVRAKQIQFLVVRKRNVFGHGDLRPAVAGSSFGSATVNGQIVGIARPIIPNAMT